MNSLESLEGLRRALNEMTGAECWGVSASQNTGSIILVQLGGKIPRKRKLRNPRLSQERRDYRSEFELYVTSVWRLDGEREVVCGAWDDNRPEGPMLEGLRRLNGERIDSFDLAEVGLDLVLYFSGHLRLKIFCDQLNDVDQVDNYTLSAPTAVYVVGLRSVLHIESPGEE